MIKIQKKQGNILLESAGNPEPIEIVSAVRLGLSTGKSPLPLINWRVRLPPPAIFSYLSFLTTTVILETRLINLPIQKLH